MTFCNLLLTHSQHCTRCWRSYGRKYTGFQASALESCRVQEADTHVKDVGNAKDIGNANNDVDNDNNIDYDNDGNDNDDDNDDDKDDDGNNNINSDSTLPSS